MVKGDQKLHPIRWNSASIESKLSLLNINKWEVYWNVCLLYLSKSEDAVLKDLKSSHRAKDPDRSNPNEQVERI